MLSINQNVMNIYVISLVSAKRERPYRQSVRAVVLWIKDRKFRQILG